jgi:hypothetical protein
MPTVNKLATGVLVWVLSAAAVSTAGAQTIALPDNDVEGFGATRMENEYKLSVPADKVEALVRYLHKRYSQPVTFPDAGVTLKSTFSDENFTDVYFDTPSQQLLRMQSAVRHRSRQIPGQPQNRKDGRQLMQIKLNIEGEDLTRSEVKFPIKYYADAETEEDRHPVLGIIDRDHRADFSSRVRAAGIDPWKLRHSLTLEQRRRRTYMSDSIGAYATITVDDTKSDRFWLHSEFTEVELELNEIRYSLADEAGRAQMQHVTDKIKADIFAQFPDITQNQTPKYNKSYERLAASSWSGPLVMRMVVFDPRMLGGIGALTVLVVWVAGMMLMRRRSNVKRAREGGRPGMPRKEVLAQKAD